MLRWLLTFSVVLIGNTYAETITININNVTPTNYSESQKSFSYDTTNHGSISYRHRVFPTYHLPPGWWVPERYGEVPSGAAIAQYFNFKPAYICRVWYEGRIVYGSLLAGEGCYIPDTPKPSISYDVLIKRY